MLHHRQRTDHDPGLRDHAPVDPLHNHIIVDILPRRAVRPRSPLPRFRSSTKHDKDRRTPSPYRRRSPPRRRSPVVPRRHRSHPRPRSRHLVVVPEAAKSYYDQLHAHPIRPTSPHLMLMTPGANGTTVTTPTTTITALLDPTLPPVHHHLNHLPTHHPTPQHHLEPCPSASLTATAKTLR